MLTVAIQTTGSRCEVCLIDASGICAIRSSHPIESVQGCDTVLAPLVDDLVPTATLNGLAAVAVACGPGSFSGLRAGCAFARALALALAIDCFGVDTLSAMVASCCRSPTGGRLVALLPARRRHPDLSWWIREIIDDRLHAAVAEADQITMQKAVMDADLIVTDAITANRLPTAAQGRVVVARPQAIGVARAVSRGWAMRPASPLHVRSPDAVGSHWTR